MAATTQVARAEQSVSYRGGGGTRAEARAGRRTGVDKQAALDTATRRVKARHCRSTSKEEKSQQQVDAPRQTQSPIARPIRCPSPLWSPAPSECNKGREAQGACLLARSLAPSLRPAGPCLLRLMDIERTSQSQP
jgi:hypothetical protein